MPDLAQQLRHAVRCLRRTPAYTIPAVASLALGIAVNTTMFSVVNATLLRPLGAHGDTELVRILRSTRGQQEFKSLTYDEFTYIREHASSFDAVAGHQLESLTIMDGDAWQRVSAEVVVGDYFALLDAQPLRGRGFSAAEDAGNDAPVVVLSDRFWHRRFAADRAIIGRTVRVGGTPFTIIGVAPPGLRGTFPGVATDVWLPAAMLQLAKPGARDSDASLMLIARLRAGVTSAQAGAELDLLAHRLVQTDVERDTTRTFVLASARGVHPVFARVLRIFLSLLMAVVAVVLLIACANVAGLLLARAGVRRAELAVRMALGASRRQVGAQLLTESFVLALLGGGAGLLLAIWPVQLLNRIALIRGPSGVPTFFDFQLDVRVLVFTGAITAGTVVVFGLLPAVRASRASVVDALKDRQATMGRRRGGMRNALVAVQVGLSFVLLVSAALLFRSVRNTATMDVGFQPDSVVIATFDMEPLGYDRARVTEFYEKLLARTQALPLVEQAALASFVPLAGGVGHPLPLAIDDAPRLPDKHLTVPVGRVSAGYFTTLRQPVLRGRDFTAADALATRRIAIVNEAMAHRFWPDDDVLGKRIGLGEELAQHEIVGVARNAKFASFGDAIPPFVFVPASGQANLHVRTTAGPAAVLAAVKRAARQIEAAAPPPEVRTMREAIAFALLPARIGQAVVSVAGAVALLLALGGIYALVCYTLQQRFQEIGIRVALGAPRRSVFRVIVGSALRLTAIGIALGAVIAAAATRLLAALLYGLGPTDPLTFGSVAVLLLLATLLAGYAAVRQALDGDPLVILRHE